MMLEDMAGKVELHQTEPLLLLARTTAPLAVPDPASGKWKVTQFRRLRDSQCAGGHVVRPQGSRPPP